MMELPYLHETQIHRMIQRIKFKIKELIRPALVKQNLKKLYEEYLLGFWIRIHGTKG